MEKGSDQPEEGQGIEMRHRVMHKILLVTEL